MPFQPFGYHFEVRSALSPDAVKAAIRSRKKGLLDPKDSARGYVMGSCIYLWWGVSGSAPMLLGRISSDGLGTGIRGRAGYATIIPIVFFVPLLILFLSQMVETGDLRLKSIVLVAVLVVLIVVAFRVDSRDAEPLVRFLRNAVEDPSKASTVKSVVLPPADSFLKTLSLEVSGSMLDGPVTPAMVRQILQDIENDSFVILSSAEEHYVQTVPEGDEYIVEKRDGDNDHHYQAARWGSSDKQDAFTFEEALTIFLAYGASAPMPSFVDWKKIRT